MAVANRVSFVLSAEDPDESFIEVEVQLLRGNGRVLGAPALVHVYLSSDAEGALPGTFGELGMLQISDDGRGVLQFPNELIATALTDADGVLDIRLQSADDTDTDVYLNVVLPSGKVVTSAVADFEPAPAPDLEIGVGYSPETDTLTVTRLSGTVNLDEIDSVVAQVDGNNYERSEPEIQPTDPGTLYIADASTALEEGELTDLAVRISGVTQAAWNGSIDIAPETPVVTILDVAYNGGTDELVITTDVPYPAGLDGVYYQRDVQTGTLNAGQFAETNANTVTIPNASVEPGLGEVVEIRLLDNGFQTIATWTGSTVIS